MKNPLKPTEAQFQQAVIEAAERLGWKVHHETFSLGTKPGYPDLTLVHPKHGVLWLELKGPRGRVSQEQMEWLDWIQQCGLPGYLVRYDQWEVIEDVLQGRSGGAKEFAG